MIRKGLFVFIIIGVVLPCAAQSLTIHIPKHHFQVDEERSLILVQTDDLELYDNVPENTNLILSLNASYYYFETVSDDLKYTRSYQVTQSNQTFTLYFTQLPIISITTDNEIIDEEKVAAQFTYADTEQTLVSTVGIEFRGGFSQTFPKKTFDLEFWEDETGAENKDVQFGNMREDDDWILDALYNEPLRIRSHIAHKLWLDMHELYYQDDEPKAKSGADVAFVEIFINGQYNGIYNLSEQVDRKQLQLETFEGTLEGELYKAVGWGASTFTNLPSYDNAFREWGGHEIKYPRIDDYTNWEHLYNFTDFVINSDESDFENEIWDRFHYDNYLDYFIFLNVLRALDNTGKNIYIGKYKADEPYFYVPWDLDACFGVFWDGTYDAYTEDILKNGFHERVIELNVDSYADTVSQKWFAFRENQLNSEHLKEQIENIYYNFKEHKIYEREELVYPNYDFEDSDLNYILNWLDNRLTFLDTYFGEVSSVKEDEEDSPTTWAIYPNPTSEKLYIQNAIALKDRTYKIYNFIGAVVLDGYVEEDFILTDQLNSGHYILMLDQTVRQFMIR